jgi:predicted ArsR family transcriptional regulator
MSPVEHRSLLAQPTRARVLSNLATRRRPVRVEAIAADLELHPNTVRLHLEKLAEAGFAGSRRVARGSPGRPHLEWTAIGGALSIESAYRTLSRWLLRGMSELDASPLEIRRTGRSIGRDMATGRRPEEAIAALGGLLAALGFEPEPDGPGRFKLCRCPYRTAAEDNPALVCSLHHGIVEGFTEAVDPKSRIDLFEPHPRAEAGCLVGVASREGEPPEGHRA